MSCRALVLSFLVLTAAAADADVRWSVPFAARVGAAQVIAVGKVVRIEGTGSFTVAHAPTVTLEVTRAIRGCRPHERLRLLNFGAENPPWADVQAPPHRADETIQPPRSGSEFLVLLPRTGGAMLRGFTDRALYGSPPDPAQVERAAAMATFHYDPPADEVLRSVSGGPVPFRLQLTNDTAAAASFDLEKLRFSTRPPGAFDDVHAAPAARTLPFRPREAKTLDLDLATLAPALFTAPGDYYIRVELPAAGPNDFFDLHVERVERSSTFLCGRAQQIARARIESIDGATVKLGDVIALRGDPAPLGRQATLPAWNTAPPRGRRAIVCWSDGRPAWIEAQTPALADSIQRLVEGDGAPLPPDPRFVIRQELPGSELHKTEVRLRLAAP